MPRLAFAFALSATAFLATLLFSAVAFGDAATMQERNKAVATRVFEEIFNQGKFAVADEIYSPEFRNHGLHGSIDLAEDQAAVHDEKRAFPDLHMTVDMLVAEGDLVTAVWTFRGTHTAWGYAGMPPTGARIEMRGMTVWRVVDGKIRDEWTAFNDLGAYSDAFGHAWWLPVTLLVLFGAAIIALERAVLWSIAHVRRRLWR